MEALPEALETLAIVLGALYLRGAPREGGLARRRWPLVESAIRRSGCQIAEAPAALLDAGLWPESIALEQEGLLSWAEREFLERRFICVADACYPRQWLERLGDGAPPVAWRVGELPAGPLVGIVGSRHVGRDVLEFAREIGAEAKRLGYSVVSGGAQGCDSAGAAGALGSALEILPFGIDHYDRPHAALSICAPAEPFSGGQAMERNALIYAASEQSVIVHAQFREGGTWTGATDALRRRLCPMLVREDPAAQAHRALQALGARPLATPTHLGSSLTLAGRTPIAARA